MHGQHRSENAQNVALVDLVVVAEVVGKKLVVFAPVSIETNFFFELFK